MAGVPGGVPKRSSKSSVVAGAGARSVRRSNSEWGDGAGATLDASAPNEKRSSNSSSMLSAMVVGGSPLLVFGVCCVLFALKLGYSYFGTS